MTESEKRNIREGVKDWGIQCTRRQAYPFLLIAMKDDKTILIWRGGQYTNNQVKIMLKCLSDSIPDNHDLFKEDIYDIF